MGGITPQNNLEATMIVSRYDVKQKELVWRSIAQDTMAPRTRRKCRTPSTRWVQAEAEELTTD